MGENITLYRIRLWFSGQSLELMSLHGSKAVPTAYHIMYGEIGKREVIFIDQ